VYTVVRVYKASGGDIALGFLWYLPTLPLCWLLGRAVERWLSTPCERWLRARLSASRAMATVTAPSVAPSEGLPES